MSSLNDPLDGSFNPLDSPGTAAATQVVEDTGPQYRTGQWLETSMPNTAFYSRTPRGNEQPQKMLGSNTPLRVIATEGTYVKVELEGGEIGYVPAIMVGEKRSPNEIPIVPVSPENLVVPPSVGGLAPEPEIQPLSVEDASAVPMTDRIE